MKKSLTIILLLSCILSYAQTRLEKRVYYLDCSLSMRGKAKDAEDIWEEVTNKLCNAIDSIEDERTEILVIPFAFDTKMHPKLTECMQINASRKEKEELKKYIKRLDPCLNSTNTNTYHVDAIRDFVKNGRIDPSKKNYMFIMTDGDDDGKDMKEKFEYYVKKWNECSNQRVYGFYVMLGNSAKNPNRQRLINNTVNFWQLETANVNINLIEFPDSIILNIRNTNENSVIIQLENGYVNNNKFEFQYPSNFPVKFKELQKTGKGTLTCEVDKSKVDKNTLDSINNYVLTIDKTAGSEFDILITSSINVTILNKPEKHLRTKYPESKLEELPWYKQLFSSNVNVPVIGTVKYHPRFLSSDSLTTPITIAFKYSFNDDAKKYSSFADFQFVDNDGNPYPTDFLQIKENGQWLKDNKFRVNCGDSVKEFAIYLSPSAEEGQYQGHIRLISHSLHRINTTNLSSINYVDDFQWTIIYEKNWNPLFKTVFWFFILILFLIACIVIAFILHAIFSAKFPYKRRISFKTNVKTHDKNITFNSTRVFNKMLVRPAKKPDPKLNIGILFPRHVKNIIISSNDEHKESQELIGRLWSGKSIFVKANFSEYPIKKIVITPKYTYILIDVYYAYGSFQKQSIELRLWELCKTNLSTNREYLDIPNTSTSLYIIGELMR